MRYTRLTAGFAALCCVMLLAGCGGGGGASPEKKSGAQAASDIKIGFIVKQPEESWFQLEWQFAEEAAKQYGFTLLKIAGPDGTPEMMYHLIKDGVAPPLDTRSAGIIIARNTYKQVRAEQGIKERSDAVASLRSSRIVNSFNKKQVIS